MTGVGLRPGARLPASGVRGVYWRADRNKFQASISIGRGRKRFLGFFDSLDDAALAYDLALTGAAAAGLSAAGGTFQIVHGRRVFVPDTVE